MSAMKNILLDIVFSVLMALISGLWIGGLVYLASPSAGMAVGMLVYVFLLKFFLRRVLPRQSVHG